MASIYSARYAQNQIPAFIKVKELIGLSVSMVTLIKMAYRTDSILAASTKSAYVSL
jgi:Golgi nucleoside diphosphatase